MGKLLLFLSASSIAFCQGNPNMADFYARQRVFSLAPSQSPLKTPALRFDFDEAELTAGPARHESKLCAIPLLEAKVSDTLPMPAISGIGKTIQMPKVTVPAPSCKK